MALRMVLILSEAPEHVEGAKSKDAMLPSHRHALSPA
jgi:hypothetical protein